jgi:ADP-heptose:LPS heptosyltransferase
MICFNQYKLLQRIDKLYSFLSLLILPLLVGLKKLSNFPKNEFKNYKITRESSFEIYVIKILGGGSLIKAAPILIEIKKNYPKLDLILIGSSKTKDFAKGINIFDRIISLNINNFFALIKSSFKLIFSKRKKIRLIYNLEEHSRLALDYGIFLRPNFYFGFVDKYNKTACILFDKYVKGDDQNNIYLKYQYLFNDFIKNKNSNLLKNVYTHLIENGYKIHRPNNKIEIIAFSNFSSNLAPEREIRDEDIDKVISIKKYPNLKIIYLFGAKSDYLKSKKIEYLFNEKKIKVVNYVGKLTLLKTINKILSTNLFVTIDSGLNNFLNLLNMSIISYWGPTDPNEQLIPNINKSNNKVIYKNIKCSPCVHKVLNPPCKKNNLCMKLKINNSDFKKIETWALKIKK